MRVRFVRSLEEMRPVLMDSSASGPDPVYEVYKDLDNSWESKTVLAAGTYKDEYSKTFGHYHTDGKDETYNIDSGEGLFLLQTPNEVLIIKVSAGEKITIPFKYGHCLINIGSTPLVTYDDHTNPQADYETIKANHGLAYYIIDDNGKPKAIPNQNYKKLPVVKWLTVEEYKNL